MMIKPILNSPSRNILFLLGVALCTVVALTAYGQIKLNAWNKPFYNALSRKDVSEFVYQLAVFGVIAGALLSLNVAQAWLREMSKLKLRDGLTRDLFNQWLVPRRAFHLSGAGEIGKNPDQRIHEDARHLVELSTDLGIGLLQSTLLLVCFITVLWTASDGVMFSVAGWRFALPGYMVWLALAYAGIGSFGSWRVGRSLVELDAERYAREADLRFALVRVNERAEAIALYGGETDEKDYLNREFAQVLLMMRRLVSGITRLTWVTAGYGWVAIVAPFIVAAPGYFAGSMSLGGLMMAVGAFNQVQQALRWFVDNFSTIADWRATLLRVASFRLALLEMDKLGGETGRIEVVPTDDDRLVFDQIGIASPAGSVRLSEKHVMINAGERVLIIGKRRSGKTIFFSAIAGLWPWGSGRILLPPKQTMMFISQQDYIPPGALRGALAYAQLQGASLHSAQLQGASLYGANLQGASLTLAQLQGASLDDAQLQGASLDDAQLQGADFGYAALVATDLLGAEIWRADFSGAQIDKVFCPGMRETAMSEQDFVRLKDHIRESLPEDHLRENVFKSIEILNPDDTSTAAPDHTKLYAMNADIPAYQKALAGVIKGLACSDNRSAASIVQRLLEFQRVAETGPFAPQLAADILACLSASNLAENDKAELQKIEQDAAAKSPAQAGEAAPGRRRSSERKPSRRH